MKKRINNMLLWPFRFFQTKKGRETKNETTVKGNVPKQQRGRNYNDEGFLPQ